MLKAALRALEAGISIVPCRADGTKAPSVEWTRWQNEQPSADQVRRWFSPDRTGLVWICGAVSGNLEVLDFDDAGTYVAFLLAADAAGLSGTVGKIRRGYEEETPGGGIHWPYRCLEIAGSMKLARRPDPPDDHGNPTVKVLVETRGEGGCVIVAPSRGGVHPSGKPYRLLRGSVETIASITPGERRALHDLARTFDEMPKPVAASFPRASVAEVDGGRPGDDYNRRGSWRELLEAHGWTWVYRRGEADHWRRPGKRGPGISATTNAGGFGLFFCFSTATIFEPERGYTKFTVYALLEHGGDFVAAARALATQGYGQPSNRRGASSMMARRWSVEVPL